MRSLSIAAALSAALALIMLAGARHGGGGDPSALYIAAGTQFVSAAAGLAIANRTGMLNLISGALILAGAALFSGAIYLNAFHIPALHALAPVGGSVMILGWIALAFAKPGRA